jgi:tRNA pseudouridine38-40 synthase
MTLAPSFARALRITARPTSQPPSRWVVVSSRQRRQSHRKVDGNGGEDYTRVKHQPDANAHPSHAIPDDVVPPPHDAKRKKKPVALLLAYVGGAYKGNTHNSQGPRGDTVDDHIEDALFAWGGILLPNYRSRGLQRLKWSRSSRTDKGVSSLCTVVSLRAEIDPEVWDADAEARETAKEITKLLPNDIACFAVYNTPKSFQARRECIMRTYEYLLPARVLDAELEGGEARIEAFQNALRAFEGAHPFHNYTKRSQYTRKAKSTFSPKLRDARGRLAWEGQEGATMDSGSNLDDEIESDSEESDGDEEGDIGDIATDDGDSSFPEHVGNRRNGTYWLFGSDPNDKIGPSHFRRIHSFTASSVIERMEITAEDGSTTTMSEPFVRVSVRGESFMLYQIRKMIATAVAVSLGYVPLEFLPASLSRPCRAAMPLAPASTLYLYDVEFMKFRVNLDESQPNRLEKLVPSDAVRADLARFQREKLEPALAPSLLNDEWDLFKENLAQGNITEDVATPILEAYAAYRANRDEAHARQDAEAAAAAAAAAAASADA